MRDLLAGLWALDPWALAGYLAIMCGLGGLLVYSIIMELVDRAADRRHRKVSDARRIRRGAQQPAATVARMAQPAPHHGGTVARHRIEPEEAQRLRDKWRSAEQYDRR